jgi:hypothetical protein
MIDLPDPNPRAKISRVDDRRAGMPGWPYQAGVPAGALFEGRGDMTWCLGCPTSSGRAKPADQAGEQGSEAPIDGIGVCVRRVGWLHGRGRCHRVDKGEELAYVERLGQVVDRSRGSEASHIVGHGIGTDHHDGDVARVGVDLQKSEDLLTPHVREMLVQQNQVGLVGGGKLQARDPTVGNEESYRRSQGEDAFDQLYVDRVALDVQHAGRGTRSKHRFYLLADDFGS